MINSPELYSLGKKGIFKGKLFGGNLQTFVMLMNEKNFFDLEGAVLFLEEEGLSADWYERYLSEIDRKGIFKKISALVFAKPSGSFLKRRKDIRNEKKILEEISERNNNLPVLANVDCGHTKPLLTFPLGVEVAVDTKQKQISYLESPVI
jgi:muramoyltetrapeptide carboxypeptidase